MNRVVYLMALLLLLPVASTYGYTASDSEGTNISKNAESLLVAQRYDELEKLAAKYRNEDTKTAGGNAALYHFYPGISSSKSKDIFESSIPSDKNLELLEKWLAEKPDSITARVALAAFWNSKGWQARGGGFSRSINKTQWDIFYECLAKARKYLRNVDPKADPEVYYLLIDIATSESSPRAELDSLYTRAIAAHPNYYHYYIQRGDGLQEKWYGKPGEFTAFMNSLLKSPGGETGYIAYSYNAEHLLATCDCNANEIFNSVGLDWAPIINGFNIRLKKFGLRTRDWNAFAFLAALSGDSYDAQQALDKIGEDWDPQIWKTKENFQHAANWIRSQNKPTQMQPH